MADFFQNGVVTVLHRLGQPNVEQLEVELEKHATVNPIALVLPAVYSELDRPALKGIVEHLKEVRYLNEIVVALGQASALEFRRAKEFFKVLPRLHAATIEKQFVDFIAKFKIRKIKQVRI